MFLCWRPRADEFCPKLGMMGSSGEALTRKAAMSVLGQGGNTEGHLGDELAEFPCGPGIGWDLKEG